MYTNVSFVWFSSYLAVEGPVTSSGEYSPFRFISKTDIFYIWGFCNSVVDDLGILGLHHVAGLAIRYVLKGRFAIIFKGQVANEGDIELLR